MLAEIVVASGKSICRGSSKSCLFKGTKSNGYPKTIKAGAKALCISVYSAGGSAIAFYCEECMKPILKTFEEISKTI